MFTLKDLEKRSKVIPGTSIHPGSYHAEIIDVTDSDKYVNDTAFIIKYRLYKEDGTDAGNFQELFFNNTSNPRTLELAKLMELLGIESADDLVGKTIGVSIKYRVTAYGKSLPSIVSRTPLPTSSAPPSSSDEVDR